MPDGDVVYYGVGRTFATAYKEVCEGYFDEDHVAARVGKALRKTLKRYGNQPVTLTLDTYADISDAIGHGVGIDPAEEGYLIDERARQLMGHRRGTAIAIDACKEFAMQLNADDSTPATETVVVRNYVRRVLDAEFFERLPLVDHHNGVDPSVVENRIRKMHPNLELEIENIVSQIVKSGRVDHLRKRRRKDKESKPDFSQMDISMPQSG